MAKHPDIMGKYNTIIMLRAFDEGAGHLVNVLVCYFFILKVFLTGTEPTESVVKDTLIFFLVKKSRHWKAYTHKKRRRN